MDDTVGIEKDNESKSFHTTSWLCNQSKCLKAVPNRSVACNHLWWAYCQASSETPLWFTHDCKWRCIRSEIFHEQTIKTLLFRNHFYDVRGRQFEAICHLILPILSLQTLQYVRGPVSQDQRWLPSLSNPLQMSPNNRASHIASAEVVRRTALRVGGDHTNIRGRRWIYGAPHRVVCSPVLSLWTDN